VRPLLKLLVVPVAIIVALCTGLFLGGNPKYLPNDLRDLFVEDDRALRAEILDTIDDSYYKEVDEDELNQASYKGIVRQLHDRFSHYFTPEEADIFNEAVSGRFEGVGMTVREHRRGLLVATVFEGSPAEKAGIRKGDVITHVNGESIAGEATDVSTAKIKGKPGTKVRLTLLVAGKPKRRRQLEVERASIAIPLVRGEIQRRAGRKIAHVRLAAFGEGAHGELRQKLDALLDRGAEGVVLDLRGNGGGYLREGVLVSSIFVEDGTVVSTKGRRRPEHKYAAEGKAIDADIPVVVLVDRDSASASEVVTGALRDQDRAIVVGQRTFGKGVVQEVEPLSNGGALDITVANYYLPSGENISHKGIAPAVKARDRPRTKRDEALPIALDTVVKKFE
jgi:carboxyl-terminal processing protease